MWRLQLRVTVQLHAVSQARTAGFSTFHLPGDGPLLVRDFIRHSLYDPQYGYFSSRPVGLLPQPIEFNQIRGRQQYMQHLHDLYKQTDISWFTPVELFKPWYGYALANYILRNRNRKFPLKIFEIGGGTGTCAKNILDYIEREAPIVYENTKYTSVEISSELANMQLNNVYIEKSHRSHFNVERRDACQRPGWGKTDENPCFIIMLEVLDNQPHDLIFRESPSTAWLETCLQIENGELMEIHKVVEDPLIHRCINIMESGQKPLFSGLINSISKFISMKKKKWIPTSTLHLLETLYAVRPNMALIVSDFSVLPDVKVEGDGAPLVARKKDGITEDLLTYLEAKGDADIFFPTDFNFLRKLDMCCYSMSKNTKKDEKGFFRKLKSDIVTTSQFMREFGQISKTQTKSGFNPLLDDYSNMKFYLS